jgi:nicotinate dehydrogenase subunit A
VNSAIGELTTIEGLGSPSQLHPLQQRFFDDQAAQCGYCINGILMSIDSVIRKFQSPNMMQIKKTLKQHLCRCGSHARILGAIRKVLNSDKN